MVNPLKYTAEKITWIKPWTDHLFSFRLTRSPGFRFLPGQFARLGLEKQNPDNPNETKMVWRAYSIVSASYDEYLEFYSIVVPDGEFTSELAKFKLGDTVYVEKMNYGFLTLDRFEGGKDLWLLSTGTGLAPFISILYELETWEKFEKIVLVHSVREEKELAYQDTIEGFRKHEYFSEYAHKLHYIKTITREKPHSERHDSQDPVLSERITTALTNGNLEQAAGFSLDLERSRIMICGNPDMVDDTRHCLIDRGFAVSRRGTPAHMAVENYW
jgi:ferredoxin--NADP+ reductase